MKRQEAKEEKKGISLNEPEACLACRTANVATFPVYLTEFDGRITRAGHVGRCANCGHIKSYGLSNCIGRSSGRRMIQDMKYWPVLKRNNIRPDEWIEAVLEASRDPKRMIWLDARNGLLPAEPDGNAAEIYKRFVRLANASRGF